MVDDREERGEMDEWIDRWETWVQESYNTWSIYKNLLLFHILAIRSVQSLSRVRLFATPWISARQDSLSITNSRSSLKLTSIQSVMASSHLILCRPLLLLLLIPPSIRVFSNESTLRMRCQSTGVSALASFLPKKSQGWSPSEWTSWIFLQSSGHMMLKERNNFWAKIKPRVLPGKHGLKVKPVDCKTLH